MNATPHHSKVKVTVTLSDPFYIAADAITGKMELESRADRGLGLGIIMVELVAIEGLHPSISTVRPLTPFFPRTDISRPFCNINLSTYPSHLPRTRSTSFKRCPSSPNSRRAPSTRALPSCPTRTDHIPISAPSPWLLSSLHRFWKWACQNSIRGPRICRRFLERSKPARYRPVPGGRFTAVPRR
jgi:hypothetical protein